MATRPDKRVRSLAELTADWLQRATAILNANATGWVQSALAEPDRCRHSASSRTESQSPASTVALGRQRPDLPPLLRADDIPPDLIARIGDLKGVSRDKIVAVIVDALTGRDASLASRDLHMYRAP